MAELTQDWADYAFTAANAPLSYGGPSTSVRCVRIRDVDATADFETKPLTIPAKLVRVHFYEKTQIVGTPTGFSPQFNRALGELAALWTPLGKWVEKGTGNPSNVPAALTSGASYDLLFTGQDDESSFSNYNLHEQIRLVWNKGGSPGVTSGTWDIYVSWIPL